MRPLYFLDTNILVSLIRNDATGQHLKRTYDLLLIYRAFIEKELRLSPRLLPTVHTLYFDQTDERFTPGTFWRLSNAFTSAFKKLDDPIRRYQATARLGSFLAAFHVH